MASYPDFIDRSPPGLVDALCSRIEKVLQSFWQETNLENKDYHIPYVHAQYLPVTESEKEEPDETKGYPIVRVICTNGIVSDFHPAENGSELILQIYFGGYRDNPDNQGWRIPTMMFWRVLLDLCSDNLCNGYLLEAPIKWSLQDTGEPPFYSAMMETKWKGAPQAIETPYEGVAALMQESEEKFEIL